MSSKRSKQDLTHFPSASKDIVSRSDRLIHEVHRALVLYARCAFSNGTHLPLPHLVDVCIMPPIMDIFLAAQPDTEVFGSVYLSLDRLLPQWISEARAQLMKELTTNVFPKPGSTSLVAFTFLQCNFCGAVRTFSSAFFHDCSNRPYKSLCKAENDVLFSDSSILKHVVHSKIDRRAWDARNFRLRPDSLIRIQNIITAVTAGNIETATSIEFDEIDPRLVCELCITNRGIRGKLAMPWRSAVSAFQSVLPLHSPGKQSFSTALTPITMLQPEI